MPDHDTDKTPADLQRDVVQQPDEVADHEPESGAGYGNHAGQPPVEPKK